MNPCAILTPSEPPNVAVPVFAAFEILGDVSVLFVSVCAPSVVAKIVPTCGRLSVLLADKLCAAACSV